MPRRETVNEWLHTLELWGYRSVRTGALGPGMAEELRGAGFTGIQDLLLMSVDLTAHPGAGTGPGSAVISPVRAWPRLRRSAIDDLLAVDSACFEPQWSLDESTFAEARQATARSRILTARQGDQVIGFVLAGATGHGGYIQRLAVLAGHRGHGHGRRLLAAAHDWLRAKGCSTAVVNTETTNHAAITLYRRLGYAELPYGLQVLERPLADGVPL